MSDQPEGPSDSHPDSHPESQPEPQPESQPQPQPEPEPQPEGQPAPRPEQQPAPSYPPAYPAPYGQPNPYGQPVPYAQPAPYGQPNPYAQPVAYAQGYPPAGSQGYAPMPGIGAQLPSGPAAPGQGFPHPEPREYHQMLRTWTYSWWRPVLGILMLGIGAVVVLPILMIPVLLIGIAIENTDGDYVQRVMDAATLTQLTPSGLLYLNLTLASLVLWTWMLSRVLHTMRPRWLSSVVPRLRWKFLFVCLGMAVIALVAQLIVGELLPVSATSDVATELNAVTGTTIALALVVLFTTPLQCAGEEYAFRGYLLQAVGSIFRNRWLSIVVTALLFATAHLQFDPPLFFDRFMFGLIAAWLVIRTGGLEAGIALHVLNNYLAFGFAIAFSDLDSALDPGDVSWWNIPVTLTQSLVYAVLVLWVAKRMKVQTRTRPPGTDRVTAG